MLYIYIFIEKNISSIGEECESLMKHNEMLEGLLKKAGIAFAEREDILKKPN